MNSSHSKERRIFWNLIFLIGFGTILFFSSSALRSQRERYKNGKIAELQQVQTNILNRFHFIATELRTISRLPSVRELDHHALDSASRKTIQEIYNNLVKDAQVSELYLIPAQFDAEASIPPVTFDSLILGKVGGAAKPVSAVPEVEIFEYREMRRQLDWFAMRYPNESTIDGLDIPLTASRELITCDNSHFDPNRPNDKDRSGMVLSVPVYGTNGSFNGLATAVLLTQVFRELLPSTRGVHYRMANQDLNYAITNGDPIDDHGLYRYLPGRVENTVPLAIESLPGQNWTLHLEIQAQEFWRDPTTQNLLLALIVQVLILATVLVAVMLNRRDLIHLNRSLEEEVTTQGKDILLQQELKKSYEQLQNTQAQLVHSEKMASLGMIAAGIAHEINNPLSYVISNADSLGDNLNQLLEMEKSDEKKAILAESREMISEVLEGGGRIKEIVQGLRHFSHVDETEVNLAQVNECIETTLKLLSNELKHGCQVEKNLGELPVVECNPGQLIQVFTNLVLNSIQAMDGKGSISVATQKVDNQVEITMSDTGPGIPPENLKNIFTPFFTTKPVGKGTGLGLSISHGIIQKFGGSIQVKSTPGEGATFTILLPLRS